MLYRLIKHVANRGHINRSTHSTWLICLIKHVADRGHINILGPNYLLMNV